MALLLVVAMLGSGSVEANFRFEPPDPPASDPPRKRADPPIQQPVVNPPIKRPGDNASRPPATTDKPPARQAGAKDCRLDALGLGASELAGNCK